MECRVTEETCLEVNCIGGAGVVASPFRRVQSVVMCQSWGYYWGGIKKGG